jgi:hypothetical protein
MNCSACGNALSEGAVFCESCGADLRSGSIPPSAVAPRTAIAQSPAAPSATAIAEMGGVLIKNMSLGEKFIGAGVLAATLGFFLPWFSSPELGSLSGLFGQLGVSAINHVSLSGVDAAKLVGAVYLILLAAFASGVLFYFSRRAIFAQRLLIGGFQVMIGSLFGPGLIVTLLFVPMIQSVAGTGFWLLGFGFSSIAAGGLITISKLARAVR